MITDEMRNLNRISRRECRGSCIEMDSVIRNARKYNVTSQQHPETFNLLKEN